MRISIAILTLLFASLLLVAGCGGEQKQSSAPSGSEDEPASPAPGNTADSTPDESATVTIINSGGERIEVEAEIADEPAEQQRGLMERTELAENAGMLFVFDREQPLSFFMRNTLIPLSIAYADSDGRIVDIQDMQPLDETPIPSAGLAQYALEVNQGFFAENGIGVGDVIELPTQ